MIIDAKPKNIGLPTEAYKAVEEVHDDGTPTTKTFEHVPSEIGAEEAEEVGVEHLLRDIKDTTVGTLSQKITNQLMGLKGLEMKLKDMHNYLQQVCGNLRNFCDSQILREINICWKVKTGFSHFNEIGTSSLTKKTFRQINSLVIKKYFVNSTL